MTSRGRRSALVLASSNYTDKTFRELVSPPQDAAELSSVLRDPSIGAFDEVKLLCDEPSQVVREEIEEFFLGCRRNDLLLLYFSGHGVKDDDGCLYLATVDTKRGRYLATTVAAGFVRDTMIRSPAMSQLLILDCCYSGAFGAGMMTKSDKTIHIKDHFGGGRGRIVLSASSSTQYAFQGNDVQGDGSKSVFTHYLIQGLKTGDPDVDSNGLVTVDELYSYVYDRVTAENPKQTPNILSINTQGHIVVAKNPKLYGGEKQIPTTIERIGSIEPKHDTYRISMDAKEITATRNISKKYKSVFWLSVVLAVFGIIILVISIDVKKVHITSKTPGMKIHDQSGKVLCEEFPCSIKLPLRDVFVTGKKVGFEPKTILIEKFSTADVHFLPLTRILREVEITSTTPNIEVRSEDNQYRCDKPTPCTMMLPKEKISIVGEKEEYAPRKAVIDPDASKFEFPALSPRTRMVFIQTKPKLAAIMDINRKILCNSTPCKIRVPIEDTKIVISHNEKYCLKTIKLPAGLTGMKKAVALEKRAIRNCGKR